MPAVLGKLDHARFAADLNGLNQIHHRHIGQLADEARARVMRLFDSDALAFLQRDLQARDDLLDVDRLGQILVDAELQTADLLFHRGFASQEHERNLGPRRVGFDPFAKLKSIDIVEENLGDDDVGHRLGKRLQRSSGVHCCCDGESRFAKRNFEDCYASWVTIDEEHTLLEHAPLPSVTVCRCAKKWYLTASATATIASPQRLMRIENHDHRRTRDAIESNE